eukprot:6487156-Pyramimonas_sp.AAC.1
MRCTSYLWEHIVSQLFVDTVVSIGAVNISLSSSYKRSTYRHTTATEFFIAFYIIRMTILPLIRSIDQRLLWLDLASRRSSI